MLTKVYLAGPMRGIPEYNFPAFMHAAHVLRSMGAEVFNPAEHDVNGGFNPDGMTGNEDLAAQGFSLRDALAADLAWITENAEQIVVLPGWEASAGAKAETATARALSIPIYTFTEAGDGQPLVVLLDGTDEVRTTSATGGQKGMKLARYDLVPADPLRSLATLYGKGASKYADRNWERGYEWSKSFAALNRHLWQFWSRQDTDDETGMPHITAVAWHAFTLAEFMRTHPEYDDRPHAEVEA